MTRSRSDGISVFVRGGPCAEFGGVPSPLTAETVTRIGMYRTAELTTHQNLTALAANLNHPSTRFRPGQDVPQGRPAWLGGSQKRSEPGADRFRDMPAPGESPMALTLNVRKERQVL